jgi:hypothetical protein
MADKIQDCRSPPARQKPAALFQKRRNRKWRLDPYRSHRSTRFHAVPTFGAILPYRSVTGRLPDCSHLKRRLYDCVEECQY